MEIGRIQYEIMCPECEGIFKTRDPLKKLPIHKIKSTNFPCPGSEMIGTETGRTIHPKIK